MTLSLSTLSLSSLLPLPFLHSQIVLGIDEPLAQKYIMEGSHYPEEMRESLKPGVTRVSFPYFMSKEVVEFVVEAVKMVAREGWKLLPQVLP